MSATIDTVIENIKSREIEPEKPIWSHDEVQATPRLLELSGVLLESIKVDDSSEDKEFQDSKLQ
jgi:hypothetical protein